MDNIKLKRFQFLKKLYEDSEQDEFKFCNAYEIGKALGLDKKASDIIVQYYVREGFIERKAARGTIGITHLGICHVEEIHKKRAQIPREIAGEIKKKYKTPALKTKWIAESSTRAIRLNLS